MSNPFLTWQMFVTRTFLESYCTPLTGMGDLSLPTTSYGGRILKGFYVNRLNKGNLNNEMADISRYI
jgi:hypothetical protein